MESKPQEVTCLNCGSTNFYRDDTTDNLVCSVCFTISQSQSQREILTEEDAFAMAATGAGGGIKGTSRVKRLRNHKSLDTSVALPTLHECCLGFQTVLKEAAETVAQLAFPFMKEDVTSAVKEKVGKIWFDYLEAWNVSANKYAKLFPELRFSFRDLFLSQSHTNMLLRFLSAKALKTIQLSGGVEKDTKKKKNKKRKLHVRWKDSPVLIKRSYLHESDSSNDSSINAQTKKARTNNSRPTYSSLKSMIDSFDCRINDSQLDKYNIVLRIQPSMELLLSILHLALLQLRAGISSHHLVQWIRNGLIFSRGNGVDGLPKKLRQRLAPVKLVFGWDNVKPVAVDQLTDLLVVACDYDLKRSSRHYLNLQRKNKVEKTKRIITQEINGTKQKERDVAEYSDIATRGNSYYRDNIPLLACRLVTDLGLHQRVLDLTLSLMGLYIALSNPTHSTRDSMEHKWLPAPLNGAHPDKLASPIHVMAVVVVACKMCRGWEQWKVQFSQFNSASESTPKQEDNPKCSEEKQVRLKFAPCDIDQVKLLGNGAMLEDYLDHIERIYGNSLPCIRSFDSFFSSLDSGENRGYRVRSNVDSPPVKPNNTLAGGINPNKPCNIGGKGNNFESFLLLRDYGAIWADANGIGDYVIYNKIKSHACTKESSKRCQSSTADHEPFHPHYGLLIEYIADTFCVEPSELHYLVACLDEEVQMQVQKKKR